MKYLIFIICLLFAVSASAGEYLGNYNNNKYDPNSISNPYGKYGSKYQPNSVNNKYGKYGSKYSNQSTNNPYATNPPQLYGTKQGVIIIAPNKPLIIPLINKNKPIQRNSQGQ